MFSWRNSLFRYILLWVLVVYIVTDSSRIKYRRKITFHLLSVPVSLWAMSWTIWLVTRGLAISWVVYHLVGKTRWWKVAVNGTHQHPEWKFPWDCVFHFHGHLHRDEYKPKGLELVEKANGTHIFRSIFRLGILDYIWRRSVYFGNFPVGQNQNSLSIYIPTVIFGFFW